VKWQFVGPVTLGIALVRIGLDPSVSFRLALQAVSAHVDALQAEVTRACGEITQIIMLDEPSLADALEPGFYLSPDEVIDLISGALAAIHSPNISGVHNCGRTDWGAMLATGAQVLSLPVPSSAADDVSEMLVAASRISDHLQHGGRIAWGAIRTDGPIAVTAEKSWKLLMEAMCALVRAGVDPLLLRRQCFITPACGLATHTDQVAGRVFGHVQEVASRVAEQATASRLTLGS
jgi:hypothetical protein